MSIIVARAPRFDRVLILEDQPGPGQALCELTRRHLPESEIIWGDDVPTFDNNQAVISRIVNPFLEGGFEALVRENAPVAWADFNGQLAIVDGCLINRSGRLFLAPLIKAGARCISAGSDPEYNRCALEDGLAQAVMDKPHSIAKFHAALLMVQRSIDQAVCSQGRA